MKKKKEQKAPNADNLQFSFNCDTCGHKNQFDALPYPSLTIARICHGCGLIHFLALPPTESKINKLQDKIAYLQNEILSVFKDVGEPMTARGVYYKLETRGVVGKDETENKKIGRILGIMRWRGWLDWDLIIDESRFYFNAPFYPNAKSAVDEIARVYRRDLWTDSPYMVQIWIEKMALASIVKPVTDEFTVKLFPVRGFNSLTLEKDVAREIDATKKHVFIYHFGDFDPSGVAASEAMERKIKYLTNRTFNFARLAITEWQIHNWNLPTRPTKKTDSRHKGFAPYSCELDTLEPAQLRQMVRSCIGQHVDAEQLAYLRAVEEEERKLLRLVKFAS